MSQAWENEKCIKHFSRKTEEERIRRTSGRSERIILKLILKRRGACSTQCGNGKCIQNFSRKT